MKPLPVYKRPFSDFVKKQHRPFQAIIEDQVQKVCNQPKLGDAKTGDLAGIFVYKFRYRRMEYLIAYAPLNAAINIDTAPNIYGRDVLRILAIDFYQIGVHENFYADLKDYLQASGWYK